MNNVNYEVGDRIAVTIPAFSQPGNTYYGVFINLSGTVLTWVADLPNGLPGATINTTDIQGGNITKLS